MVTQDQAGTRVDAESDGEFGLGLMFVPITILSVTGVRDHEYGLASGLVNTSQQIGGALGLAILSTIAASRTASLGGAENPQALVAGFHWAFAGGAIYMLAGLAVMTALLRQRHVARIEAEVRAEPAVAGA